jgi:hypothetical protein
MRWCKQTRTLDCSLRWGFSVCFDGWFWPPRKVWTVAAHGREIAIPGVVVTLWR